MYNVCIFLPGGSMLDSKINLFARLIVRAGLNVKKGQLVVVNAHIEAVELARAVVKEAYKAGAKEVIVRYNDEIVAHERYLHADDSCFEQVRACDSLFYNETAQEGACYLSIIGADPDLMKDVDPWRISNSSKLLRQKTMEYRNCLDTMKSQWCVVPSPSKAWAKKVFPELDEKEALLALWDAIFYMCQIDDCDPVDVWNGRKASFAKKVKMLNDLHLKSLHYKNGLGTDLVVELCDGYRFEGGESALLDDEGTEYFANIPTEEVFSAPKRSGVNGRLVASMPLIHGGNKIEDFWFEFKNGRVVDFDARTGKEVLKSILNTDEGSSYLGEVALVPAGSAIQSLNRIFYNTLIDENASCHFALGKAYNECVEGGLYMDDEQLLEHGLNVSFVHVDFMVGTNDLSIVGLTASGEQIPVFVDGKWTSMFD